MPEDNLSHEQDLLFLEKPQFYHFHQLFLSRIEKILVISSLYDRYALEADGSLSDQVLDEYLNLNLSSFPKIFGTSSGFRALKILKHQKFDLIITMSNIGSLTPFDFGKQAKKIVPNTPIVLLLSSPAEIRTLQPIETQSGIDRIFTWTGDSKIFIAIIKLFEDRNNLLNDVEKGNIQIILIVEDSIRYYSLFLPLVYDVVMKQTQELIDQSLNQHYRMLRRRARPKIVLATSYEEGKQIFEKYKNHILVVISDVAFPKGGRMDLSAGHEFINLVKEHNKLLPTILQSSDINHFESARGLNSFFLHKGSRRLLLDLKNIFVNHLGFGDFIFRLPNGKEIGRASNLEEFIEVIQEVPEESIMFHASRNHFSAWLMARGEFDIAYHLRPLKVSQFDDLNLLRLFLKKTFEKLSYDVQKGAISDFSPISFGKHVLFSRLSSGSLGGKGRGLAFLHVQLPLFNLEKRFPNINIKIPQTLILCTGEFDQFIEQNNLDDVLSINEDITDEELVDRFVNGVLSQKLRQKLEFFLQIIDIPLAVRSSGLLEDSHAQPLAGIYKTYMLPNNDPDLSVRLEQLCTAIKLVYASLALELPRSFIMNIGLKIEEEKMAVIVQEVVGQEHEDFFYPDISGVAQSYNFYPTGKMKPEDGVAFIALGLGKTVVEGKKSLRFCPKYPQNLPQFSSPGMTMKNSQKEFFALNLKEYRDIVQSEDATLSCLDLTIAEKDGILFQLGSVYDISSNAIRDGLSWQGPRVLSMAGVLKFGTFPLPEILVEVLKLGTKAFGRPIEIEFAANILKTAKNVPTFYLLQIRPLVFDYRMNNIIITQESREKTIVYSTKAMGNGIYRNINDIIAIKPEKFDRLKTVEIAKEVSDFNKQLRIRNRSYVLIGLGRWGTREHSLGVPIKWNDISNAKVIVEAGIEDYDIEASYGTHFFSNITALNIAYLTIPVKSENEKGEDYINWNLIRSHSSVKETEFLRHIQVDNPLEIRVNGKNRTGIILKN
ncbi:MAG: PEP/pyruvate-binding domain-containing protein [Promethearchaeota archaeon]